LNAIVLIAFNSVYSTAYCQISPHDLTGLPNRAASGLAGLQKQGAAAAGGD
jgi:hypothetical protein